MWVCFVGISLLVAVEMWWRMLLVFDSNGDLFASIDEIYYGLVLGSIKAMGGAGLLGVAALMEF